MKLERLGIIIGHTVTQSVMDAAIDADLPESAMAELWPTRTINKAAMARITDAMAEQKRKAKNEEKKEGDA